MPFKSKLLSPRDPSLKRVRRNDYGQEVVLDIHNVPSEFFKLKTVREFAENLCDEIGMIKGPLYTWGGETRNLHTDYKNPKADGISCVQFLYSSSITIHAIDEINKVFINVFSCEQFDGDAARDFALKNVGGDIVSYHNYKRK